MQMDWYVKRIGLGGIYVASGASSILLLIFFFWFLIPFLLLGLHMMADSSPEYASTWSFVERLIDESLALDHHKSQV